MASCDDEHGGPSETNRVASGSSFGDTPTKRAGNWPHEARNTALTGVAAAYLACVSAVHSEAMTPPRFASRKRRGDTGHVATPHLPVRSRSRRIYATIRGGEVRDAWRHGSHPADRVRTGASYTMLFHNHRREDIFRTSVASQAAEWVTAPWPYARDGCVWQRPGMDKAGRVRASGLTSRTSWMWGGTSLTARCPVVAASC
jgi:hypothetical protein